MPTQRVTFQVQQRWAKTTCPAFVYHGALDTSVKEASDVVGLPNGSFLVVGDRTKKIACVKPNAGVKKFELEGLDDAEDSQFEGVAYDEASHTLFVSREESREILRYAFDANGRAAPQHQSTLTLEGLKSPKNKGIEGLAFLPKHQSPTKEAVLLAAKEANPRELLLLSAGTGAIRHVPLDERTLKACDDVSALAVCPLTGHVFVASEESSTVVEIALLAKGPLLYTQCLQSFRLKDEEGKNLSRVEGLAFNPAGDLFVLTENDGTLRHFERQ